MNEIIKKYLKLDSKFSNKFITLLNKGETPALCDFFTLCRSENINPFFSFFYETRDDSEYFQNALIMNYTHNIARRILFLCHKQHGSDFYNYLSGNGFSLHDDVFIRHGHKEYQQTTTSIYPYLLNIMLFENIKHPQNMFFLYYTKLNEIINQNAVFFERQKTLNTLIKTCQENCTYRSTKAKRIYYDKIMSRLISFFSENKILKSDIFKLPENLLLTINHKILYEHISFFHFTDNEKSIKPDNTFFCFIIKNLFYNRNTQRIEDFFNITQMNINDFNQHIISQGIPVCLSCIYTDYALEILNNIQYYNQKNNDTIILQSSEISITHKINLLAHVSLRGDTAEKTCLILKKLGFTLNSLELLHIIKTEKIYKDNFIQSLVNIFFSEENHFTLFEKMKDHISFSENRNENFNINKMLSFLKVDSFTDAEYWELMHYLKTCSQDKRTVSGSFTYMPYSTYAEDSLLILIKKEFLRTDNNAIQMYQSMNFSPLYVCCESFIYYINAKPVLSDYIISLINTPLVLDISTEHCFLSAIQAEFAKSSYYFQTIQQIDAFLKNININPFSVYSGAKSSFGHCLLMWLDNNQDYLQNSIPVLQNFLQKSLQFKENSRLDISQEFFKFNHAYSSVYQQFLLNLKILDHSYSSPIHTKRL